MNKKSLRQLRVAEEIKRKLAEAFVNQDFFSLGLERGFLMVTEADVSPDLSYAIVFIRSIGKQSTDEVCAVLNEHKGLFRKIISSLRLRIVPDLVFKNDTTFDEAAKIDSLLASPRVQEDVRKSQETEEE